MTDRERIMSEALRIQGPKLTEEQSEAIDQIRELWETLPPVAQKEMIRYFLYKLPVA